MLRTLAAINYLFAAIFKLHGVRANDKSSKHSRHVFENHLLTFGG